MNYILFKLGNIFHFRVSFVVKPCLLPVSKGQIFISRFTGIFFRFMVRGTKISDCLFKNVLFDCTDPENNYIYNNNRYNVGLFDIY